MAKISSAQFGIAIAAILLGPRRVIEAQSDVPFPSVQSLLSAPPAAAPEPTATPTPDPSLTNASERAAGFPILKEYLKPIPITSRAQALGKLRDVSNYASQRPYAARYPELFKTVPNDAMRAEAAEILWAAHVQAYMEALRKKIAYDKKQGCFKDRSAIDEIVSRNLDAFRVEARKNGEWARLVALIDTQLDYHMNGPWDLTKTNAASRELAMYLPLMSPGDHLWAYWAWQITRYRAAIAVGEQEKTAKGSTGRFFHNLTGVARLSETVCRAYYRQAKQRIETGSPRNESPGAAALTPLSTSPAR